MIIFVVAVFLLVVSYFVFRKKKLKHTFHSDAAQSVAATTPGKSFMDSELDRMSNLIKVTADSVRFDFASDPAKPMVQVLLTISNQGKYDVFVERMTWQIMVGLKHSPSAFGIFEDAFLLLPQTSHQFLPFRSSLSVSEARYVVHSKKGLVATGHIGGIISARIQRSHIEKKFSVPDVTCIVHEQQESMLNIFIDPTHLDPLLGLLNRKFLEENMQAIVDTASIQRPVSFVMIDVDDFKRINDEYGHLIGDDVLKAVAGTMREAVADKGFPIRYGGDEFSILLQDHDIKEAKRIAEEVRSCIANRAFKVSQKVIQVTISVGVTMSTGQGNYTELIQQADDLLRRSKKSGKNIVSDKADDR